MNSFANVRPCSRHFKCSKGELFGQYLGGVKDGFEDTTSTSTFNDEELAHLKLLKTKNQEVRKWDGKIPLGSEKKVGVSGREELHKGGNNSWKIMSHRLPFAFYSLIIFPSLTPTIHSCCFSEASQPRRKRQILFKGNNFLKIKCNTDGAFRWILLLAPFGNEFGTGWKIVTLVVYV